MLVLAFDCSTSNGSVAIFADERILFSKSWRHHKSHGETLISNIQVAISTANVSLNLLDMIAVCKGPGRFTGIRIAVNTARALAYSLNKPILAFSSLRIMAEMVPKSEKRVLSLLNAHKNMVYLAHFHANRGKWELLDKEVALPIEELDKQVQSPVLCLGDGYKAYSSVMSKGLKDLLLRNSNYRDYPQAEGLCALVQTRKGSIPWNNLQPLYIRYSEAEEKLKNDIFKTRP